VKRPAKQRLAAAQDRVNHLAGADNTTWERAIRELHEAEREWAAARGQQYAETVDIGAAWDVGAPLPHLIAGPHATYIVCYSQEPDPNWDGTYVTMLSPSDEEASALLVIEIARCHDIRYGGPNDEAIHGHPLHGKGLSSYRVHEVHNSEWLESVIRVNAVHPHHSDEPFRRLHHYVLSFHDEMIEALGQNIQATRVVGTFRSVLFDLVSRIVDQPI